MPHTLVNPAGLHDPTNFGYSHSAAIPANAELVLIAGQYGSDPTGEVISEEFSQQVDQAFRNVGLALTAHGLELSHVVQLRSYVVDHDFDRLGTIGRAVGEIWGTTPPTHTVIGVACLATPDISFEIEAVAVRP